jgi:hypothetical protein
MRVAPNDGAHVLEVLVQPPKDVEDEDPVFNGCVEVNQIIDHDFELAAVLIDREVTLNKSTKGSIKVKSTLLRVTEKLVLDGEPEVELLIQLRTTLSIRFHPGSLNGVSSVTCLIRA